MALTTKRIFNLNNSSCRGGIHIVTQTHLLCGKPLIQLLCKFCLQYSVEVTKVHPLFAVPVVNDVVAEGISWVHTLLYSSFYFAVPHFQRQDVHNTVVDERREKRPASRFYLWIHWGCFFFFLFWPGPAMGILVTSEFIPHSLKWWHTPGFVVYGCVCAPWGFPVQLFGLTSPPHQWHTINYYTCSSMHLPSLVSAGNIFCLSFSKVVLLVLHLHPLARLHCLPYSMLMGLTDVLQSMGRKEFIL